MRRLENAVVLIRKLRGGFLFVELIIGLVIVAMVMLGAAAILDSVAEGWNDEDVTRSTQVQANQTYLRIQNALEGAKFIGYYNPGSMTGSSSQPACIFFWQNTNIGGQGETDPCVGEMALIEYDPTTQSVWLYHCTNTSATGAGQTLTLSDINEQSEATWFAGQSYIAPQCLGGPGNEPNDGTRLDVAGLQFYVSALSSTSQLPVVEFAINFTRTDGTNLTLYSSTTLKGPTTQPE